jgi:hypothetical protein
LFFLLQLAFHRSRREQVEHVKFKSASLQQLTPFLSFQQHDREVLAARAETSSIRAALSSQLQALQTQVKEAQESYELKLMMTASDAMERENKIERQLKDAAKEIEELRGKLSQGPRQTISSTPATDVLDCYEEATSVMSSNRQQLPSAGFSQKNLLLRSAPQAKRPRTDVSQQQMPPHFRASPMTPTSGESCVTPHVRTQGVSQASASGTAGPCNPLSVDAIRELVTLNAQTLQQRSTSPEMLFIQLCLRSGITSPFKQLLQALSESGSLGESEALMHGAELLSSL